MIVFLHWWYLSLLYLVFGYTRQTLILKHTVIISKHKQNETQVYSFEKDIFATD